MRFAILTAVSSKAQAAEGKDSLPVQEETCRKTASAKGWLETAGPFVIPGQPRTGYVNLSDAERDIPALAEMLQHAAAGEYDVLVLYDYTRLRDLIALVAASLADYNVQIFSLAQAVEPVPPEQFDPAMADAAWFNQTAAGMTSRAEINALRRRFRLGMPGRVTNKGLHPLGRLPYGYRKPPGHELERLAVPEPDPATAPAVRLMRDLLFAGRSLPQIAEALDAAGYRTWQGRPWNPDTIRRILRNPYYAGIVTFGVLRRQKDARAGRKGRLVHASAPVYVGQGKHAPLWDEATHRRILDELERRGKSYVGRRINRLTGLLACAVCERPLWVGYHSWENHPPADDNRFYRCASNHPEHPRLKYTDLLDTVIERIEADLRHPESIPALPVSAETLSLLQAEAAALEARRLRAWDAYLKTVATLDDYQREQTIIKTQLAVNAKKQAEALDTSARDTARKEALEELTGLLDELPRYLRTADPQTVNASLRHVLEKILVDPDGKIELFWR